MTAPPAPVQGPIGRFETRYADFVLRGHEFAYGNENMIMEDPRDTMQYNVEERAGSPDSLANQDNRSAGPSLSSSGYLTRCSDSPGPVLNGFGFGATGYFFTTSTPPLPLAPQYQMPAHPRFALIDANEYMEDEYAKSIRSTDLDMAEEGEVEATD